MLANYLKKTGHMDLVLFEYEEDLDMFTKARSGIKNLLGIE